MSTEQQIKTSQQVRESYRKLPFQAFWIWLTGKELVGRKPMWRSTSIEAVVFKNLCHFSKLVKHDKSIQFRRCC